VKKLPLKTSEEYESRVRYYALELKRKYGKEVAGVFLKDVKKAEARLKGNCHIGTSAPYVLDGKPVILQESYFESGPAPYCTIFEITAHYVGLITLWHGIGSRQTKQLQRLWRK